MEYIHKLTAIIASANTELAAIDNCIPVPDEHRGALDEIMRIMNADDPTALMGVSEFATRRGMTALIDRHEGEKKARMMWKTCVIDALTYFFAHGKDFNCVLGMTACDTRVSRPLRMILRHVRHDQVRMQPLIRLIREAPSYCVPDDIIQSVTL